MDNVLNSPFVNYILRLGLSKSGIAVRWIVGILIGALVKTHIFPANDLHEISLGLTSGITALFAIAYGALEWWLQHRQKDGVRTLQAMANQKMTQTALGGTTPLALDGVAGNATVNAMAKATHVKADYAVTVARDQ